MSSDIEPDIVSDHATEDEITRIHCNIITHWLNKDGPGKPYEEYEADDKADILKLVEQAETAARKEILAWVDDVAGFYQSDPSYSNDHFYVLEHWQFQNKLKGVSNE